MFHLTYAWGLLARNLTPFDPVGKFKKFSYNLEKMGNPNQQPGQPGPPPPDCPPPGNYYNRFCNNLK